MAASTGGAAGPSRSDQLIGRSGHQHGGVRCAHGSDRSTWAASDSSVASSPGAVASITPTGRPVRRPVGRQRDRGAAGDVPHRGVRREPLLRLEVGGRVGVVTDRSDRQRRGGERGRQHRVVRRQRGQRPRRNPAELADREPELRPAHRHPATRRATWSADAAGPVPRSDRFTTRERGQHRPAGLEDGHGVTRERHLDVDDLVAERLQQPARRPPTPPGTPGRSRRRRSPGR